MEVTTKILSDVTVFTKYAKYDARLKRRETWSEIVYRNMNMHIRKFPHLEEMIMDAYTYVLDKSIVPSMRSLQFGGKPIEINPARGFNCSALAMDNYKSFGELMFLLLGGTGVGIGVQKHQVEKLPAITKPTREKRFLIGDSIEGWAQAIDALMSAYFRGKTLPVFDYRDIRPKGARLVTAGGKAPGHEPLKVCLDMLKRILDTKATGDHLTSIECHDIACFIADAVLAGGIRRAALISIFDHDDEDMLRSKSNFVVTEWEYATEVGPVTNQGEPVSVIAKHVDEKTGKEYFDLDVTFEEPFYGTSSKKLYWVSKEDIDKFLLFGNCLPWFYFQPQRGRANNSAVFVRHKAKLADFELFWERVKNSGSGEPGIYWTNDKDVIPNPCCEISLKSMQMCNLTEVNVSNIESQEDLNRRVRAATLIGTLQASYTDFHYLREQWKKNCDKDALLGVSMTGIGSGVILKYDLEEAAKCAVDENKKIATLIGIKPAARITTVKPSGTTSLVLGSSSGIHAWHDAFYIRRMRLNKKESLYKYLSENHPEILEDDFFDRAGTSIISIPVKAPAGSILRSESPFDLLERVKKFHTEWILGGHIKGDNTHNVSVTISIKDDEWESIGDWMWKNRDHYNGISVLPFDNGSYVQPPFQTITEDEYNAMAVNVHDIDLTKVVEEEDNTDLSGEQACGGNGCSVV